jgi:hypothetical protein
MSGDVADDWLGMDKPKAPAIIPPAKAPTLDEAAEGQVATDRLKFRKGRASTRFGSAFGTTATAGYKLLGASR